MAVDYSKLNEITVKSQEELDNIPLDFKGRIFIEFGTVFKPAIVKGNSRVVAYGNSSVVAYENSSVEAWGNSRVVAYGNSSVEAYENSRVVAYENSRVVAYENSSVEAWGNSRVVAYENSRVVAYENSSVEARENSRVVANANVQVVDRLVGGKIQITGNARIVYMPKNLEDFMNFYGIKHSKTKGTFYKAVRKINNKYVSNYDSNFIYEIGKTKAERCDESTNSKCSFGIHISSLQIALNFGSDWSNVAILEVESKLADIVLPKNSDGKVRTSEIKVIREVPLSECGIYGKILEKRHLQ